MLRFLPVVFFLVILHAAAFASGRVVPDTIYPFPDGMEVTSNYMAHRTSPPYSADYYHKGIDCAVGEGEYYYAPFDCTVTLYNDRDPDGFGHYLVVHAPDGYDLLLGDIGDLREVAKWQSEAVDGYDGATYHVNRGDVIAYGGGTVGSGTGPHLHFEVWQGAWGTGSGTTVDPEWYIMRTWARKLGHTSGADSELAGDGAFLPSFSVEDMYSWGEVINEISNAFWDVVSKAYAYFLGALWGLLVSLVVIDFVGGLLAGGLRYAELAYFVTKIFRYSMFFLLLRNWPTLVEELFLGFATAVAETGAGSTLAPVIAEHAGKPQMLFQIGVHAVAPALSSVFTLGNFVNPFVTLLGLLIFLVSIVVMAVFLFAAVNFAFVYIEFYLVSLFAMVGLVLGSNTFLSGRFRLARNSLGSVFSSMLKLCFAMFFVGMVGFILSRSNVPGMFGSETGGITFRSGLAFCTYAVSICIVVLTIPILPSRIAKMFAGGVNV